MNTILTIELNGAIYLPKSVVQKFHIKPSATFRSDCIDEIMKIRKDDACNSFTPDSLIKTSFFSLPKPRSSKLPRAAKILSMNN